ncbi:autotransporter outer membrane beta-barrel domain-containing protein [Salmonella enterica]|nr:autotransporter outer membrane beta-barrel domain-containing protein [Salmonella enterica]EKB1551224.1 autotransporter outer membrane beta-barrel domain-containing protein [Salmonella enterica]EKE3533422.1 autotransporter outer membrane beta-barrel domain-containing protein [Salmonella enterica]
MNKIYALKYSAIAGGVIAVSEFSTKCTRRIIGKKQLKALVLLSLLFFSGLSGASIVSSEIDYQIFRDFAGNKGIFKPGTTNISIYNKKDELVGILNKAPMPDFSSVGVRAHPGVATLINPQYIVSVKHNSGYQNVRFGDGENEYNIVDRNDHASQDFHVPRLDKLVTEVVPAAVTAEGQKKNAYANTERYTSFYRLGSGMQYIKDKNGNVTWISEAYSYLTGGTVGAPSSSDYIISSWPGNVFDPINGPLSSYGAPGDSGSPLFAYDSWQEKWVIVGVLSTWTGENGTNSRWAVIPLDFIERTLTEDNDVSVTFNSSLSEPLLWSFDQSSGTGSLAQASTSYKMHGQKGDDLNAGKNVVFSGNGGQIDIRNDVSQGAGSLTFKDDYTVFSSTGNIWTGAGIIVDKGASVIWQVNGVKEDNLHKIGEGTLHVNGSGVNEGGLKVGDGTVVLNQQADKSGQVQAFNSVNIASGRPTVVLADDRQVNPDNVSWGYRGGTLDVNGNSLTFHQLKAADYGAVLANNAGTQATITLDYTLSRESVVINNWADTRTGTAGELYEYSNPYTKTTDYFILKKDRYGYFPTNQSSNDVWEYVGNNRTEAQKLVADRENEKGYLYHGQLKGNLNVSNAVPQGITGALVLDGSADVSGTFTQENGRLTLQGHPVVHAYNDYALANKLTAIGDTSVLTQPTSFGQDDWECRVFTFDKLELKNTDFGLSRNATLNTIIEADNSVVTLGDNRVFIDKKDGDGTAFVLEEGKSDAVWEGDRSIFNGSATLTGNTQLNIINSVVNGDITGYSGTQVQLSRSGRWNMDKSSTLDTFRSQGGNLSLVTPDWSPKNLTVNTMDANSLHISLGVSIADSTGDRVDILQKATGGHNILDLTTLFDQSVLLKNDLTLASAPAGTSHSYFSFASLNRGFTVYTPDTQVQEKDGKVLWQLKSNTPPGIGENNGNNGNVTVPDTPGPGEPVFKGEDNTSLLKKARSLFTAREYIISSNVDHWQQVADNAKTESGPLVMAGYSHGGYGDFTVSQSGLDIGFITAEDMKFWGGASIGLYKGHSSTDGYRDDYNLWGGNIFFGISSEEGLFADGGVGYKRLSEQFSIQGELTDLSGKADTNIFTAGARVGWRRNIKSLDMSVTPSASLNGVQVGANRLKGEYRSAEIQSGRAVWLKTGILAEKDFGGIMVTTGLYRNFTLDEMPGMVLSDAWKARHYSAERADRYTATIGIDGKITEKLHVQVKLNSSFGGYFRTDCEGGMGVRYDF